ncbi:hypothetical protein RRG08_040881 [Elysia crispata]|uniref:Uncharacterized protein n=1 Tax=Elysia crispata TaxID=231223 RepID=A0AAE1AZP0_9GAST|nr:hypothetical protein RRG08_040881 [Elysia crispata]
MIHHGTASDRRVELKLSSKQLCLNHVTDKLRLKISSAFFPSPRFKSRPGIIQRRPRGPTGEALPEYITVVSANAGARHDDHDDVFLGVPEELRFAFHNRPGRTGENAIY